MADCTKHPECANAHHLLMWAYDLLITYREELRDYRVEPEEGLGDWKEFEKQYSEELSCGMEEEE